MGDLSSNAFTDYQSTSNLLQGITLPGMIKRPIAREPVFSSQARAVRLHAATRLVFATGNAESRYAVKPLRVPGA